MRSMIRSVIQTELDKRGYLKETFDDTNYWMNGRKLTEDFSRCDDNNPINDTKSASSYNYQKDGRSPMWNNYHPERQEFYSPFIGTQINQNIKNNNMKLRQKMERIVNKNNFGLNFSSTCDGNPNKPNLSMISMDYGDICP